jgi:hypothetical protein
MFTGDPNENAMRHSENRLAMVQATWKLPFEAPLQGLMAINKVYQYILLLQSIVI